MKSFQQFNEVDKKEKQFAQAMDGIAAFVSKSGKIIGLDDDKDVADSIKDLAKLGKSRSPKDIKNAKIVIKVRQVFQALEDMIGPKDAKFVKEVILKL